MSITFWGYSPLVRDAHMLFKMFTCILALVVSAEAGYIFLHRHPSNRFKQMDDYDYGFVAFDTATGQLCKTWPMKSYPSYARRTQPLPSSDGPESHSGDEILDKILDAMNGRPGAEAIAKVEAEEAAQHEAKVVELKFIRTLPTCADIR
jgi:hypothetical protein